MPHYAPGTSKVAFDLQEHEQVLAPWLGNLQRGLKGETQEDFSLSAVVVECYEALRTMHGPEGVAEWEVPGYVVKKVSILQCCISSYIQISTRQSGIT